MKVAKSLHFNSIDRNRDFTDHMLQARQEAEQEEDPAELANITDVHLRQTIIDIFFGNLTLIYKNALIFFMTVFIICIY